MLPDVNACPVDAFDDEKWLDKWHKGSYDVKKNNIHGTFAPIFDGKKSELKVPDLLSVDTPFYDGNFLLLPGSTELSFVSMGSQNKRIASRKFGVFRKVFDMIAQAYSTQDSPL